MTIYTRLPEDLPTWAGFALCAALGFGVTACDVQWGGAQIALVDPAPETEVAEEAAAEPERVPLPEEPLLFAVGMNSDGARAVPVALLLDEGLADLGASAGGDETFWPRFEQTLQASGSELGLYAGGIRVGSLVMDSLIGAGAGECPAAIAVSLLLPPGSAIPQAAFAHGVRLGSELSAVHAGQVDNRMRASGPVLAERLLTGAGENRPYLAQRTSMEAIFYAGDQRDAMVATYIVNDRLEGPAPSGAASSVFFMARFVPSRGYVPVWSEVRRYGQGSGKESFSYLESFAAEFGRVDVLVRRDGSSRGLAAGIARESGRQLDWLDPGNCDPLRLIGLDPTEPVAPQSAAEERVETPIPAAQNRPRERAAEPPPIAEAERQPAAQPEPVPEQADPVPEQTDSAVGQASPGLVAEPAPDSAATDTAGQAAPPPPVGGP